MHATNRGGPVPAAPSSIADLPRADDIRSILAVTDLESKSERAVERAAQLALAHGATLKLMVASWDGAVPPADAASRLARSVQALRGRIPITVRMADQTVNALADVAEEALCADLVVMPEGRGNPLLAFVRGSAAERLARICRCPILVARQAAQGAYERILVTVDFSTGSRQLVQLACGLDDGAEIHLFHAISTRDEAKLRSAEASAREVQAFREACLRHARDRIVQLSDSFDARRNRVMSIIGHGDPARQAAIQQDYVRADLLVVGRRRRSPVADFFLGSAAERMLRWTTSDVLIAPLDPVDARAASGAGPRRGPGAGAVPAQAR
ncbi:MAG: universal stress protein [Variovorax sp.]|nr:universal stress protein [Variovorax sp.]